MPAHNEKIEYAKKAREALSEVAPRPGVDKPDPIIVAESIKRVFGGLTAVDVERLQVQRHGITALIGPNGAGKTTLFNLLTCFDRAQEGSWKFNSTEISKLGPHKVAKIGMVRTFQLTKSLYRLSVMDNMRLAATAQRGESLFLSPFRWIWRKQEAAVTARAEELLTRFKLIDKKDDFAAALSGGQRKLLEMARALMVNPEIVMLDEPMAGVNPALKQSLLGHIKSLRDDGMTVLFVEHDMDMVRDISDWVIVMAQGRIVAEGTPDEVMRNQAVVDAYLGAHHDTTLEGSQESMQPEAKEGR
jgi:neutral amino acid transport system ATP-binding protein